MDRSEGTSSNSWWLNMFFIGKAELSPFYLPWCKMMLRYHHLDDRLGMEILSHYD